MRSRSVLAQQRPDAVIVQGDTTTAMSVALAGYYRELQGGPRRGRVCAPMQNDSPFPEEINRRLIGQLADFQFRAHGPARQSQSARRGNQSRHRLADTGNTVVDALEFFRKEMQHS